MTRTLWRTGPALLGLVAVVGCGLRGHAAEGDSFALVELYTSEGCSSCPPADQVMSELAAKYAEDGQQVVWLGFHVDYWNKLGWRDRFSSRDSTQRQYHYAQVMHRQRVYTPQMVVDGRTEFVGSRRADATRAIDAALKLQRDQRLTISSLGLDGRTLTGQLQLTPGGDAEILVAVTENGLVSQVESGENEGRTLHHDHVVRRFATGHTDGNGRGHFRLELPDDAVLDECQLVVVAQSQRSMRVGAAAAASLADLG